MTKIIGLTGPSGAGKGVASAIFAKYGIPAVDTDAIYHDILSRPDACTRELVAAFGDGILGKDGVVDRKKLGATVLGHAETPSLLHTLNTITHKYIMAKARLAVQDHATSGVPAVLIDAPQLFEAGIERECDLVLAILAPKELRLPRIMERDGITQEAAQLRLAAQHEDAFFRERCDAVIENDGDAKSLERAICQFLTEYGVIA